MGDLDDRDKVRQAVEGMDVIIHLGAYPTPPTSRMCCCTPMSSGCITSAMPPAKFGVKRLSLASSVQTIMGFGWPDRLLRMEEGVRPTNHYAPTKVWAEEMGHMYARAYDLSVVNVRIGWLPRDPGEAETLKASRFGHDVFSATTTPPASMNAPSNRRRPRRENP